MSEKTVARGEFRGFLDSASAVTVGFQEIYKLVVVNR